MQAGSKQSTEINPGRSDKALIPGRIGVPEDMAGAAIYLAAAECDYVVGSTFYVDGGLLLR